MAVLPALLQHRLSPARLEWTQHATSSLKTARRGIAAAGCSVPLETNEAIKGLPYASSGIHNSKIEELRQEGFSLEL
jgi:hypothetical protein